jgi:hypothetical protein
MIMDRRPRSQTDPAEARRAVSACRSRSRLRSRVAARGAAIDRALYCMLSVSVSLSLVSLWHGHGTGVTVSGASERPLPSLPLVALLLPATCAAGIKRPVR